MKKTQKKIPQNKEPGAPTFDWLSLLPLFVLAWIFWRGFKKFRRKAVRKEINTSGYVVANGSLEHRLIAERVLGRRLVRGEVVHHINGIKTDNRESNLCVLDEAAHILFHSWVNWKYETDGRYPPKRLQRAVLRDRYKGILLVTYPDDLPPTNFEEESKRGTN